MSTDASVQLSPRWKQAVVDFLAAGFKDGDIVSHAWLEQHFGIEPLADGATLTKQQHADRQFKLLGHTEAFKAELLEEHQILLLSVFREGYRVTPPAEQTGVALERFESEMRRSFRSAGNRIKHIRFHALTDSQRRENTDAISRLSMLRGMVKTIE